MLEHRGEASTKEDGRIHDGRTSTIRPNDDSTVGKPSTPSDPLASFTKAELEHASAWMSTGRHGELPAPVVALVEWLLTAQEHLTSVETVAVATLADLERRCEILDRAYARGTA